MGLTEFLLVIAVGGGIIAVLFATFRGAAAESTASDAPGGALTGAEAPGTTERAELEERQRAVIGSLEEIEADLEAGNLTEADYEQLRRRYEREAASLLRQLNSLGPRPASERVSGKEARAARPAGSRWPAAVGWSAGIVGFAAIAWLAMSSALRPRVGDDTITGGPSGQDLEGPGTRGAPLMPVDMERLAALERMVAADSGNVEALVELGRIYISSQRLNEATQVTLKALSIDPDNAGAHTYLGMVLISIDHVRDGLAAFDRALESDPDFADALLFKGMVSFREQDFQAAVAAWEHYLEVAPPEANLDRVKGMLEGARAALTEGAGS